VNLGLETLRKRRQSQIIFLFLRITANDDLFPTLNNTFKSMESSTHNMDTRINTFNAIACDSSLYLQCFLLRTVKELCMGEIVEDV